MNPLFLDGLKVLAKAVPGTLGGAIAGYYTGRMAERAKRADRIKEDHLAELKSELLEILRLRLRHYYSPACNHTEGIVERTVISINKGIRSIAENPYVRSEFALRVIPLR